MILLSTSAARIRRTLVASVVAGAAAGALVPGLTGSAGPVAARATFAGLVAAVVLLARRTPRGLAARAAIAALFGALGGLVERSALDGGTALLGLGLGLVLAPAGTGAGIGRVLRAAGAAFGALAGAALAAEAARYLGTPASPAAWDAALGASIALGAVAADLVHAVTLVPSGAPAELEDARRRTGPELRATLDAVRESFLRVRDSVRAGATTDATDRIEALATAHELAITAARRALVAEELSAGLRDSAAVARAEGVSASGAKPPENKALAEAQVRLGAALAAREARARDEVTRSAVALAKLALALAAPTDSLEDEAADLEARARGLAFRLGTPLVGADRVASAPASGK